MELILVLEQNNQSYNHNDSCKKGKCIILNFSGLNTFDGIGTSIGSSGQAIHEAINNVTVKPGNGLGYLCKNHFFGHKNPQFIKPKLIVRGFV